MEDSDAVSRINQLLDLEPARVAVVLVDLQRDFCGPPGRGPERAGTEANARAAVRANDFAGEAARLGARVIYSRQVLGMDRLSGRQRLTIRE